MRAKEFKDLPVEEKRKNVYYVLGQMTVLVALLWLGKWFAIFFLEGLAFTIKCLKWPFKRFTR
jgi:hypothetical protein